MRYGGVLGSQDKAALKATNLQLQEQRIGLLDEVSSLKSNLALLTAQLEKQGATASQAQVCNVPSVGFSLEPRACGVNVR